MINFEEARQLVIDALADLVNDRCPYCQRGGLVKEFISDKDIIQWVGNHKLVYPNQSESKCS